MGYETRNELIIIIQAPTNLWDTIQEEIGLTNRLSKLKNNIKKLM